MQDDPIFQRLCHHPITTLDELEFYYLLARSISLDIETKRHILEIFPELVQEQIDEFIKVFEYEQTSFQKLSETAERQKVAELTRQASLEWIELLMQWGNREDAKQESSQKSIS